MNISNNYIRSKLMGLLQTPFSMLYSKWMSLQIQKEKRPKHIGLILDGNRRFARMEGLQKAVEGHARGADRVEDLLNWCEEFNVPIISIWIFSTDNFKREKEELDDLFSLIEKRTYELIKKDSDVHKKRVKLRYIGRTNLLPQSLQDAIKKAEEQTKDYDKFILNVAIAYGGQEEITDAVDGYLGRCIEEGKTLEEARKTLSKEAINAHLYTAGLPEPDLIIRTSGEIRMSGFLLWQSVHSEFYFTDVFWPHFDKLEFLKALYSYAFRQRRFGK